MKFTWDKNKCQANIKKHGLDFADAPIVFDGATFTFEDDRFPYAEQRFITIGILHGRWQKVSLYYSFYYTFSPGIADLERQSPVFKEAVKIAITPLITSLSILNYMEIDSEEKVLGYGISLILLNVGMYILAPVGIGLILVRRSNRTLAI